MAKRKHTSRFHHLKKHWKAHHGKLHSKLTKQHTQAFEWFAHAPPQLVASVLAALLLATGSMSQTFATQAATTDVPQEVIHSKEELVKKLTKMLPQQVDPLIPVIEDEAGRLLSEYFHLRVVPELAGKRLNRSYGYIGAEQHLMRYPGDTIDTHFQTAQESASFSASGMAPGRGAWGYFTDSLDQLSQQDIDREKYYIAVQTFLSPGWGENTNEMYQFFKFRKMLVVNPQNGKAVVVVIGDAGPAAWTGKHLGGSPEVMRYLERVDGAQKGSVLYYFIDDPANTVPLGPIDIQ